MICAKCSIRGEMPQTTTPLLSEDISLYILNFHSCRLTKVLKMFRMAIFRGPIKNAKCVLEYFIEFSIVIKSANMIMNNIMFIQ